MFLRIDPDEPEPWLITRVADVLRRGGVAVLPTDTLYGIACRLDDEAAVRRVRAIKGLDPKKPLAVLLPDLTGISRWTKHLESPAFFLMKRVLPGPYTFVVQASGEVPRAMLPQRKTIGIRVPDQAILQAILAELGTPLVSTSVLDDEGAFVNEPLAIEERLGKLVDVVVDAGVLGTEPSTVVDLSSGEPELIRAGKGDVAALRLVEE